MSNAIRNIWTVLIAGLTGVLFAAFANSESYRPLWLGLAICFAINTVYRIVGAIWPDAELLEWQWYRQWPHWPRVFMTLLAIVSWVELGIPYVRPLWLLFALSMAYFAIGSVYAATAPRWETRVGRFLLWPLYISVAAHQMGQMPYKLQSAHVVLTNVRILS